jgi:hypothetical protein
MASSPVAIVGAAETAEIGTVALSTLGLATDAARRALADCGLTTADVDGVASTGLTPYLPVLVAHSLGIEPRWMTRPWSAAARTSYTCAMPSPRSVPASDVVLITHGESARTGGAMFRHARTRGRPVRVPYG